jgi:thioredoxin-dependent peroxiredoxin
MKKYVLLLLTPFFLAGMNFLKDVEVGQKAPVFKAVDSQGKEWNLKNHLGKNYIVMFFYPGAMTGGCTQQACSYRDNMSDLEKLGAKVVGISGDNVEGLKLFKETYDLNFDLLSDSDGTISKKYGVPLRDGTSMERTIGGKSITWNRGATASRWTFVLDKKGNLIYKNQEVKAAQDSQQVIEAIKQHMARS